MEPAIHIRLGMIILNGLHDPFRVNTPVKYGPDNLFRSQYSIKYEPAGAGNGESMLLKKTGLLD